jgi:hypothetical protein
MLPEEAEEFFVYQYLIVASRSRHESTTPADRDGDVVPFGSRLNNSVAGKLRTSPRLRPTYRIQEDTALKACTRSPVGWRRTPRSGVRPTEILGDCRGPRLDESRLDATLRQSDPLLVQPLRIAFLGNFEQSWSTEG